MTKRTLTLAVSAGAIAGLITLSAFAGFTPRLTKGATAIAIQFLGAEDGHEGHDHSAHEAPKGKRDSDEGHDEDSEHEEDHDEHDEDGHEGEGAGHGDDEGHDEHEEDDGHEGHDHSARAEENLIQMDKAEWAKYGIKVAVAGAGTLENQLRLPGEIKLNEDRIAHIVPRAAGIVREVSRSVGDNVIEGDVMAWIESAELSEAKVDYFAKWAELGCCKIELARAEEIQKNTSSFLALLGNNPSLEDLQKINGSIMGENRSKLVSVYAEYVFARSAHEREKSLFEKKIGSEEEYLAAANAFKKANADFMAARDSVGFEIERELLDQRRKRQVQEIELLGAERRLHLLGLTDGEVEELPALAQLSSQSGDSQHEEVCADPNCEDCRNEKESESQEEAHGHAAEPADHAKMGWYPLRAPFDGTVIGKHIALGEKVSDETDAFTVADLASVWADLNVFQKDLPFVRKGMGVSISVPENHAVGQGKIQFVSPVLEKETRTALARVILPNPDGQWRPGLFVDALVLMGGQDVPVKIPKTALQILDGETVVFIEDADGFEPMPVTVGHDDGASVEIQKGLKSGQRYVVEGAFELKSQIITSGLDAHAGHGH
jgi:cobalt-zinc-cadmium efflux system membrane fusion protein